MRIWLRNLLLKATAMSHGLSKARLWTQIEFGRFWSPVLCNRTETETRGSNSDAFQKKNIRSVWIQTKTLISAASAVLYDFIISCCKVMAK
jgi:hypothetical protein